MMDFTLSDGRSMILEDCGDSLGVKIFSESGELYEERNWDIDSVAEMLFG